MKITPLTHPIVGADAIFLQLMKLGRNKSGSEALLQADRSWSVIKADNKILYAAQWRQVNDNCQDLRITRLLPQKDEGGNYLYHPAPNDRCKRYRFSPHRHFTRELGTEYLLKCMAISNLGTGHELFIIPNYIPLDWEKDNGIGAGFVTEFSSFFVESDDLSIEEQWEKFNWFAEETGLIPSLIVFSGGKSLHGYFKLKIPITDSHRWQTIQRKLILIFQSDPNIQNPNREMRLAGPWRASKKQHQSVEYYSDNE